MYKKQNFKKIFSPVLFFINNLKKMSRTNLKMGIARFYRKNMKINILIYLNNVKFQMKRKYPVFSIFAFLDKNLRM